MLNAVTVGAVHTHTHTDKFIEHILKINTIKNKDPSVDYLYLTL